MKILIIALSARPFVEAAVRAGYQVTAIDAFCDKQTSELADSAIVVDYDSQGFNANALLQAVSALNTSEYLGFVYGSGFDAQPELLKKIAQMISLIGNAPETVRAVKTAVDFFAGLDHCKITYPHVSHALPEAPLIGGYLRKFAGGSGGTHITVASADDVQQGNNAYYQRYIEGRSVSLLFMSHGRGIDVIGFNDQWLSPETATTFRYGGAVSRIALSAEVQAQLTNAAEKLSQHFGLIGLNSMDAVVQNDVVYILEINPRLSATVDLYEDENLLEQHVQVCLQSLVTENHQLPQATISSKAKAHCIVYATENTEVPSTFDWPSWAVDTPQDHLIDIPSGAPICTVLAHADFAEDAKQLANIRAKVVQQLLQQNH